MFVRKEKLEKGDFVLIKFHGTFRKDNKFENIDSNLNRVGIVLQSHFGFSLIEFGDRRAGERSIKVMLERDDLLHAAMPPKNYPLSDRKVLFVQEPSYYDLDGTPYPDHSWPYDVTYHIFANTGE